MKKNRRPINRIIPAFFAVVVLLTAFVIPASAYPAEQWIPASVTDSFGASSASVQYSSIWATVQTAELQTGVPNTLTFGNLVLSMADLSQPWTYVSFQADVASNGLVLGHYTCGFYRENGGDLHMRIGRTNIDNVPSTYPVDIVVEGASSFLFDFTLEKLTDGSTQMRIESFALDANNQVLESGVFDELVPARIDTLYFGGKTQYARCNSVSIINYTEPAPHTARDLIANDAIFKQAEQYGYENGETDGFTIGYDTAYTDGSVITKTIWDIVSMPFDIVANILNFDILGLNLWTLVAGLFTVVIVFWVLKKVGVV